MDWSIQFYIDKKLDPVFIYKFFYFLVSRGVKYNATGGGYSILARSRTYRDVTEKEVKESTEKLAEIIDEYLKFDLKTTHLDVVLNYIGEYEFKFMVYMIPVNDQCLISFEAGDKQIRDERAFLFFINLCKEAFVRLNFVYGAYRTEYQDDIPLSVDDFIKERPDIVNYYSRFLVDEIGRGKLLSTPAYKVEELENGGIMLIVCTEPLGCDNIDDVWRHLGYK